MQGAFGIVVFGVVAVSLVMSLVFLVGGNSVYDEIGQGGLDRDGEPAHVPAFPQRPTSSEQMLTKSAEALRSEREQEIRQMLEARSQRRVARGGAPLDVQAELAKLIAEPAPGPAAAHDAGIAEEVLQIVVARNERRERQGLQPLDIDTEVQRTLAELSP